jgi:phage repressor protein C with HTH and peptisase S24 domain
MLQNFPMGFAEDVMQGLRQAKEKRFGNVERRFALAADYDPTNLGRILKGKKSTWLESFGRLADAAGLRVVSGDEVHAPDYAFIKKALARPAAGGGSLETSGETENGLVFRREWLRSRTTSSLERLRVMTVSGDSMSPTMEDGDVVLIDEGKTELLEDRVYVVRKGEDIYVKRFRKAPDALLFMGDNRLRDYQDVKVTPGEEDGFAVIGRVLWAGKEL